MPRLSAVRCWLPALLAALVLGGTSGCQTVQSRARQRPAAWAALDPAAQARVQTGKIAVGDTADTVYLAQGTPDRRRERVTDSGREETWTYLRRWQENRGQTIVGVRPVQTRDAQGNVRIYYENIQVPQYEWREQERLRVTLQADRVIAVEEPARK